MRLFSHAHKALADREEQDKRSAKWLTQSNKLEGGRFKPAAFDGEGSSYGILSRDGRTLYSCSHNGLIASVYQAKEEAEKNPLEFMKFELGGIPRAVSGKGNRIVAAVPE